MTSKQSESRSVPCACCGKSISVKVSGDTVQGRIMLNIPAVACEDDCTDELLELVDPIVGVKELSAETAVQAILETRFTRPLPEAADFFCALYPTSPEIYDASAVRLYQNGLREEAHRILERGILTCMDNDQLYVEKAAFLGMEGNSIGGLLVLKKVSNKETFSYYVISGNLLRGIDKWDEAADCWRKAIKADRSQFIPHNNLGYYLLHIKKDYAEAEKHYRDAALAIPSAAQFVAYRGDALFFLERYSEARSCYENALTFKNIDDQLSADVRRMLSACKGR